MNLEQFAEEFCSGWFNRLLQCCKMENLSQFVYLGAVMCAGGLYCAVDAR